MLMLRKMTWSLRRSFLRLGLGALTFLGGACGSSTSTAPPPRAAVPVTTDGGLPPPAPSVKKGLIVPSDTGLGSAPTGTGTSTGTEGRTMPPSLGSPGN